MSIDLESEQPISFAKLAGSLQGRRQDRPIHPSTIHRWRSPGIKGVRLEAIRVGGAWHTTRQAFARFCERLTNAESQGDAVPLSTAARRRAHDVADDDLEAGGW